MIIAQAHLISFDVRSAGLARVFLALAKTRSKTASHRRPHGKTIATNLNLDRLAVLPLIKRDARRDCQFLQSP
jgi:hypothetical protein